MTVYSGVSCALQRSTTAQNQRKTSELVSLFIAVMTREIVEKSTAVQCIDNAEMITFQMIQRDLWSTNSFSWRTPNHRRKIIHVCLMTEISRQCFVWWMLKVAGLLTRLSLQKVTEPSYCGYTLVHNAFDNLIAYNDSAVRFTCGWFYRCCLQIDAVLYWKIIQGVCTATKHGHTKTKRFKNRLTTTIVMH